MIIFKKLDDDKALKIRLLINNLKSIKTKSSTEHARLMMLKACLIKNEYLFFKPEDLPF